MVIADLMLAPLILGMGHSVETDHLAAVGNLVDVRGNWLKEAYRGASWGLGHTVSVVLAAIMFGYLKVILGNPVNWPFEILAGLLLVMIGSVRLCRILTDIPEVSEPKRATFFNIGLVHGLAGSGTIAVLLTGQEVSYLKQFTFLGLFGTGTIIGMAVVTGLLTQFKFLNHRYLSILSYLVALISLVYGFQILINQFS